METKRERDARICFAKNLWNQKYHERAKYVYKILRKIRRRNKFPKSQEFTWQNPNGSTYSAKTIREIHIYTYTDVDYVVCGYLTKNGNIRFIKFDSSEEIHLPISPKRGSTLEGNIAKLTKFYERAFGYLCITYRSLTIQEEDFLFMFEHIERFLEEYELTQKQTFWYRAKHLLRGQF